MIFGKTTKFVPPDDLATILSSSDPDQRAIGIYINETSPYITLYLGDFTAITIPKTMFQDEDLNWYYIKDEGTVIVIGVHSIEVERLVGGFSAWKTG